VAVLLLTTNAVKALTAVASGEDPSLFGSRPEAVEFPDAFQLLKGSVWSASDNCLITFWRNIKE